MQLRVSYAFTLILVISVQDMVIEFKQGMRFLAVTLAIAGLYILAERIEISLGKVGSSADWYLSLKEKDWQRESDQIPQPAAASREFWPRESRLRVFVFGLWSGRAAEALGNSILGSSEETRAREKQLAAEFAEQAAMVLMGSGLSPAAPLSFRTLNDSNIMEERLERDENGMAAAISQRFSVQHAHLYKPGLHLGVQSLILMKWHGELSYSNLEMIGRNAVLAGVPREFWYPLTQDPNQIGIPLGERSPRYEALIDKLRVYLAGQD